METPLSTHCDVARQTFGSASRSIVGSDISFIYQAFCFAFIEQMLALFTSDMVKFPASSTYCVLLGTDIFHS